ncbi:MAG TPA: CvpA family protein [Epsilonproteobacteria bacterium]|nr:CvpA family protein [Campylobacterota bacterium]
MDFNYFDLVVGIIVLLLGLKGIVNGFFKEVFGLIGIVGGIFVASRVGDDVGQLLSDALFSFDSQAAISFTGFLFSLAIFWVTMIAAGLVFKKLSKASGLGPVDKIFGFIVGSGKFFLIGSVIAYAVFNIQAIRVNLEPSMKNSFMFPAMVATGSFIMKLDPVEISEDINTTIDTASDAVTDTANTVVNEQAKAVVEDVKEKIEQNIPQGE